MFHPTVRSPNVVRFPDAVGYVEADIGRIVHQDAKPLWVQVAGHGSPALRAPIRRADDALHPPKAHPGRAQRPRLFWPSPTWGSSAFSPGGASLDAIRGPSRSRPRAHGSRARRRRPIIAGSRCGAATRTFTAKSTRTRAGPCWRRRMVGTSGTPILSFRCSCMPRPPSRDGAVHVRRRPLSPFTPKSPVAVEARRARRRRWPGRPAS